MDMYMYLTIMRIMSPLFPANIILSEERSKARSGVDNGLLARGSLRSFILLLMTM